jgi:hypothetical protein
VTLRLVVPTALAALIVAVLAPVPAWAQAVEGAPGSPECSDGIDNDGDGEVDSADPDCGESFVPPGAVTGTTYQSGGGFSCLFVSGGQGCAPAPQGGVIIEARQATDPGPLPAQDAPLILPPSTTSGPDGSYRLELPFGLWTVTAHIQLQTFSFFAPTPSDTIPCSVNAPGGPASTTISLDFGQTESIDWYCGATPGLGSLFGFLIPGLPEIPGFPGFPVIPGFPGQTIPFG